jgi:hypothetical protein
MPAAAIPARFRPVADVALVTGRPKRTIRTWAANERVPSIKHRGQVLVDLVAAAALSEQTGRRNRTPNAA